MIEVLKSMYAPFFRQWRKWNVRQRITVVWWQLSLLFTMCLADAPFSVLIFAIVNLAISSKFLIKVPTDELGGD